MKRRRHIPVIVISGIALIGVLHATALPMDSAVIAFRSTCARAMDDMMTGMAAPSTNDVDQDFVRMMVPHHQAAIDMARAELQHGKNEKLRRIAQEIIIDQQQEITVMHMAVGGESANVAEPLHGADAPHTKEPQ